MQISCLTCDIWTSNSQDSYLNLSLHFIDDSWNLWVLGLYHLDQSHSFEYVLSKLNQIRSELEIPPEKVLFCVADLGALGEANIRSENGTILDPI